MSDNADCGCCEGVGRATPVEISNRPGLAQIAYRVGTHSAFKSSMIAALSDPAFPGAGPLTTRDDGDFSIAFLDAWSVSADILTFYQERLANESYLRTAGQQRSVFELARLVGYKPSPGVAASTALAYTLNDAPGAPDPVTVPAGSRAQSIPPPGQIAATFETSADLVARIEHNALAPQSALPVDFSQVTTQLWFSGTSTNLKPGDAILFVAENRFNDATSPSFALRIVTKVTVDAVNKRTLVAWDRTLQQGNQYRQDPPSPPTGVKLPVWHVEKAVLTERVFSPSEERFTTVTSPWDLSLLDQAAILRGTRTVQPGTNASSTPKDGGAPVKTNDPPFTAASKVHAYALRRKASLFGANAIDPALASKGNNNGDDWSWQTDGQAFYLDAAYQGIVPTSDAAKAGGNDPAQYSWAALTVGGGVDQPSNIYDQVYRIDAASEESPLRYMLSNKATKLSVDTVARLAATYVIPWTRRTVAFAQSEPLDIPDQPILAAADTIAVEEGMIAPVGGSSLTLIGGARLVSKQVIAVSGKRLRLQFVSGTATFTPASGNAAIAPALGDYFLLDAWPPTSGFAVLTPKGVAGSLNADPSQLLLVPSDGADPDAGELATIDQVSPGGTVTALTLKAPLMRLYDRATAAVNANVVAATHGETVNELLGGGNAAVANQRFTLKQSPLTYVSTAQGQGALSTLQVWVNDLLWHEQPSFLASGPADRDFVTRQGDGGVVTVQFGDGAGGARPPTGQINIRAKYRKGIGLSGMAAAGQISMAIDRPGGLRGVVNPQPATGGADPDGPDDARNSVPVHVQTLDRVVSLADYENYARAFAGVAKAFASWAWFGLTRGVAVTVCGAGGSALDPNGETITNLAAALTNCGNPHVPLKVMAHRQSLFSVGGQVRVDADHDPGLVMDNVRAALSAAFGFSARNLGQPVAQSEVIAAIQGTGGVVAVELTRFALNQAAWAFPIFAAPPTPASLGAFRLVARHPLLGPPSEFLNAGNTRSGRAAAGPATLLLIDPASLGGLGVWL